MGKNNPSGKDAKKRQKKKGKKRARKDAKERSEEEARKREREELCKQARRRARWDEFGIAMGITLTGLLMFLAMYLTKDQVPTSVEVAPETKLVAPDEK